MPSTADSTESNGNTPPSACSHSVKPVSCATSGRPGVAQETGFTEWLQADGGVLPFDSVESAVDGIERVSCDYERHCRLARVAAADFFDSSMVLEELLKRVSSRPVPATGSPKGIAGR